MRQAIAIAALMVLGACGVDGAPIQPQKDRATMPGRHAPTKPDPDKWIGGTVSAHTAVVL